MNNYSDSNKVILVDDDKDDCELFKTAFADLRMNTSTSFFHNGVELLEYFETTENELPNILFLDLNMPIMGGLECLKILRSDKKFKDLPIVIYSTSKSNADIEDTLVAGANVYVTKPNNFPKLKKILSEILKVQWNFHHSHLDKETFLMVVD